MANSKDVDKILQNLKKPTNSGSAPNGSLTSDRLSQIIAQETAKKNNTQPQTTPAAVNAVPKQVQKDTTPNTQEIESEFFSKLATALKENPAVADLVEDVDENLEAKSKHTVNVNAASYVDEKFVDFFTTSVAVPKTPSTTEILVKRKKGGFFHKKYITDSLTLSIPQEEVDKRQQKVVKTSTAELAKNIITDAAQKVLDKETPTENVATEKPAKEKKGLFGRRKEKPAVEDTADMPLFIRYKTDEFDIIKEAAAETAAENSQPQQAEKLPEGFFKKAGDDGASSAATAVAERTQAQQPQFLPESQNYDAILYYDDGKAKQPEEKPQPAPRDAESILKAIRAKKQTAATVVAGDTSVAVPIMVTTHTAQQNNAPTVELKEKHSPFVPKQSFEDTIENPIEDTGYIPSQLAQAEEKEFVVVEKTPQDSRVSRITGDITQMFAAAGVVNTDNDTVALEDLPADQEDFEQEEIFEEYSIENEYITQQFSDDPEEIADELNNFKATLAIRMGLSAVCAVILLYFNFAAKGIMPLPSAINPMAQPMMFYLACLVIFAIAVIGFLPTLANGIIGFAKAPTQDSFMVVPAFWSFVQLNVCIFSTEKLDPASVTVFAAFTVLALGFNALGKFISATTIMTNLSLADVPEGINAGYVLKDMDDVKRLARTLEEKNPQILVSRKTGYISNFISGGFSTHKSEHYSKLFAILTAVLSLIGLAIGWKTGGNWIYGVFAAAGISTLMLPLSHSLISSVPGKLMQKALGKVGALVNGWQGIYQLNDATHVSFDAKHLFPKGCVVLHGIKTFEKERLDLAILYAASIAIEYVDNLRSVFMTVIDGKKDMLYPIESCEYKVGQGYVAWIENSRVIMGNRSIMEEYDIKLPPVSMETAYLSDGKKPIYLSVNGKLFGMFVVSYHYDLAVKDNLLNLIKSGKCVILQSNDFNVDSQLLELVYGLPQDTVQVLNKNETTLLLNYTAYSENTDSAMAHLDSLHSLSAGFFGADKAKRAAATCSLIQILSIITGAVLGFVFTVSQTIWSMPVASILLLSVGWLGLTLVRALATKYY